MQAVGSCGAPECMTALLAPAAQQGGPGAAPRRTAWLKCREVLRGRCAHASQGRDSATALIAVRADRWAAQQRELRQLREQVEHQGRLLAAASEEAECLQRAAARSDRGGSMSSEAPSEGTETEAPLQEGRRSGCARRDGSGAGHLFTSASGPAQRLRGTPSLVPDAPAVAQTEGCGGELWAEKAGTFPRTALLAPQAASELLQQAPRPRAVAGVAARVARPGEQAGRAAALRIGDALGRAARAVAAAALPHRFTQGSVQPPARESRARGGTASATAASRQVCGSRGARRVAEGEGERAAALGAAGGQQPRGAAAAAVPPGADAQVAALRAALLGQQLRAATAALWALPAVEAHGRAAAVHAEWTARGELTLVHERCARGAEAAAAFQRHHATTRLGADGVLRLQDSDGRWLSKSQFRKKYKGNRQWQKVLRRCRQAEAAALVPRQRSKKADFAFRIDVIARCVASYARHTWAIVSRSTAISWMSMAVPRIRCWREELLFFYPQRRSFEDTVPGGQLGLCAQAVIELDAYKAQLRSSPERWAAREHLFRRVDAWRSIFEDYRTQYGDMCCLIRKHFGRILFGCSVLGQILGVDPLDLPGTTG
eukprot:TRINITY_DN14658_c1_g1_i1.p1 TRINITY_DN14658_c1_g1~~TRINITY_DN14658_c1_g1_i1.p1  ORF type:complete len:629 (+),score=111.49 TRINITY_DN14658_c1_g1_i1:82-1887(+)